jgi:carboxypeptidase Q
MPKVGRAGWETGASSTVPRWSPKIQGRSPTVSNLRHPMKSRRITPVAVAAALAGACLPALSSAQTFTGTADPIIKRIWQIGQDSSQVEPLAQTLLDSLGPRLMGSPNLDAAQNWVVKMYQSWGVDAKREEFGTWRGWRRGVSHIDLIAPRVRTLEGMMVGFSPGTGGKDVVVEPIILPAFKDSLEFVKWLPQAKGKMVMISAPQQSCRPSSDWNTNATASSIAKMAALRDSLRFIWGGANVRGTGYSAALGGGQLGLRLEEAGAAGAISFRFKDSRAGMEVFETYNKTTPTIALTCEDYGLVFRLADRKQGPKLRINLDAQLLGERPVANVIASIKGSTKPNEYVMMSAHFDSWDGGSGATDNGTGTLTMLEAMRILKKVLPNPQRTILVGHWAGEEEGLIGSRVYASKNKAIVDGMQALLNQDNGTGRITRLSAAGWPMAPNKLLTWWDKLPKEFQDQAPFFGGGGQSSIGQGGGGSDNASFACYGAPTIGLGAAGWDYSNYTWHTEKDTYDKVVFDDLRGNATLTAMLVYLASEDPEFIKRDATIPLVTRTNPNPEPGRGGAGGGRGGAGAGRGGAPAAPGDVSKCPVGFLKTEPRLR